MKLFADTKKLIDTTKIEENVPYLEVVKVVLGQSSLVDNQYQEKSELLTLLYSINFMLKC